MKFDQIICDCCGADLKQQIQIKSPKSSFNHPKIGIQSVEEKQLKKGFQLLF